MPNRSSPAGPVVALGSFDGVHLGHRRIVDRTRSLAREYGVRSALLTWEPLPAQLIHPEFTYVLTPTPEKTRLLVELGLDAVFVTRFDEPMRRTEPAAFIEHHIITLSPRAVVAGHDHRFGRLGAGDVDLLRRVLGPRGIGVDVVPEILVAGGPVRSTRIRERLLLGDVARAAELLGRPYRLEGGVAGGAGIGRRIGLPTLNLVIEEREKLIPADGVYAVRAEVAGRTRPGLLNIGHRPTFRGETRSIEVHLLDTALDRAPDRVGVLFAERLRPERKFPTPEDLARQIRADADRARRLLPIRPPNP